MVLFYWKLEWSGNFFVQGSSVSKSKTNGECYQKSDSNKYFLLELLIRIVEGDS